MQHFFVEPGQICGKTITIVGDDVNHIKNVLRMKVGEELSVSNGLDDNDYRCVIDSIEEDSIILKLIFIKEDGIELPARITLFQGLPKSDKMELIIQKAVELGVHEIVPVATKRAVVKLDDKKSKNKVARWQGISEAAAKQSKRAIVPEVRDVMTIKEAISYASSFEVAAIPYEMAEGMTATKQWISDVINKVKNYASDTSDANSTNKVRIGIFIGPEGGFDESEIDMAMQNNIQPISLGRRILRTETAGMTTLSILMYHLEIME